MRNDDVTRDVTLETAKLGIEAETFLRSSLGRFIIERADLDIEQSMVELVDVDPGDFKANREVRNKILVARQVKQWLGEAINAGRVAHEQLIESEALDN